MKYVVAVDSMGRQLAKEDSDGVAHGTQPLSSKALLRGARVRAIEHAGERYYLRLTRKGRLILSK